jgi:hypothetical protein
VGAGRKKEGLLGVDPPVGGDRYVAVRAAGSKAAVQALRLRGGMGGAPDYIIGRRRQASQRKAHDKVMRSCPVMFCSVQAGGGGGAMKPLPFTVSTLITQLASSLTHSLTLPTLPSLPPPLLSRTHYTGLTHSLTHSRIDPSYF